jgi:hypothetical protein
MIEEDWIFWKKGKHASQEKLYLKLKELHNSRLRKSKDCISEKELARSRSRELKCTKCK